MILTTAAMWASVRLGARLRFAIAASHVPKEVARHGEGSRQAGETALSVQLRQAGRQFPAQADGQRRPSQQDAALSQQWLRDNSAQFSVVGQTG